MNRVKFEARYASATTVARKVYDVVPMREVWTHTQIIQELLRQGRSISSSVVSGCLNSLVNIGLIRETSHGFVREAVRDPVPTPTIEEPPMITTPPVPAGCPKPIPVKQSPLEILANLAARTKELAGDIEHAALSIQEQLETSDEDSKKLKQLQALLKSLG